MNKLRNHLPLALIACAIFVAAICLFSGESHLLKRADELNLFLDTPLYFRQQMVVAGGLLTWIGTWFTQFFFHPWMGIAWLVALWALIVFLAIRAFRLPQRMWLLALIPVALLLITIVDTGYWLYYLKLRGHFFVGAVGTAAALALVWAFRSLPEKTLPRAAFIAVSSVVAYPLFGFYGLVAVLTMGILSLRVKPTRNFVCPLVAVICTIGVPLLFYRYVYYQTNIVNIYWAALPLYKVESLCYAYYIPYYLLGAWFALMAASYGWQPKPTKKEWKYVVCQLCQLAVLAIGVYVGWYKDDNFHKELEMHECATAGDWEGILRVARDEVDEPTRSMVVMKNLALFRLGRQGDEMYRYINGAKEPNAPFMARMTQICGRLLYLNYGKVNFCYRWCLEDGVEFGWRVEYLKYMTSCAILNGEYKVARKYIDILKHTKYHRTWAEQQERFLANPSQIASDGYYGMITHMMKYPDMLDSDNTLVEMYLLNQLARTGSDDPILQEAALLAALQMKDIAMFWPQFNQYAILHRGERMPIHYQEAAYLYGHLENKVDISKMPFDKQIAENYAAFMQLAQQCAGMTEEQMKPVFYPRFGNTFFYDYFLIRGQKSY